MTSQVTAVGNTTVKELCCQGGLGKRKDSDMTARTKRMTDNVVGELTENVSYLFTIFR